MLLKRVRPIEGVYCNLRKSHSKSLRDGIFAVKLGFFAKNREKHLEFRGGCTVTSLVIAHAMHIVFFDRTKRLMV